MTTMHNLPIELRTLIASRPELRPWNRMALGAVSKGWRNAVRNAPSLTNKQEHLLGLVYSLLALGYQFTMFGPEVPSYQLTVIEQLPGRRVRTNRGIISKRTLYNFVAGDFARCHTPRLTWRFTRAPTPVQLVLIDSIFADARSVSVHFAGGYIERGEDGMFTLRALALQPQPQFVQGFFPAVAVQVLDRAQIVAFIASRPNASLRSMSVHLK